MLTGFAFNDFSDAEGLNLVGTAETTPDGRLRLTNSTRSQIGGAWFVESKPFVGVAFETTFDFQITDADTRGSGNKGFAFVIQNESPTALMASAVHLGYNHLPNSIAVEFRPGTNVVSIQTRGVLPNNTDVAYSSGAFDTQNAGIDFEDGNVHSARIVYDEAQLSLYLDDIAFPVIQAAVSIPELLDLDFGRAWVGLTASNHVHDVENHDILNWALSPLVNTNATVGVEGSSILEGDNGTSDILFEVTRMGDAEGTVSVEWTTVPGTALPGEDFVAESGTLTFSQGESSKMVSVAVLGDISEELHETFQVQLLSAPGVTIVAEHGTATIYNDEATLSIGDATAVSGDTAVQFIDEFTTSPADGGFKSAHGMTMGPDGHLYVASDASNSVLRYNGQTGAFMDRFVGINSGGLNNPEDVRFGPDDNLYVSSKLSDAILRYDGQTGAFIDVFADTRANGMDQTGSFVFAPDGHLYVNGGRSKNILRYNSTTGAFVDEFLSNDNGALAVGPDGNLYVGGGGTDSVRRYRLASGRYIGDFFNVRDNGRIEGIRRMEFRTDGFLYVSGIRSNAIHRYDAETGTYVDDYILRGQSGLDRPNGFAFDDVGNIFVVQQDIGNILRYGPKSHANFAVSLSAPLNADVTVDYETVSGSAVEGSDYVDKSGSLHFPANVTSQQLLVQTVVEQIPESDETFSVVLSNAVKAEIGDGQGTATITGGQIPTSLNLGQWYDLARLESRGTPGNASEDVAVSGNTIVVGAGFDDREATNAGAVHVFLRDDQRTPHDLGDDRWNLVQELRPDNLGEDHLFGESVAVEDNTIVVTASHRHGDGLVAAYVYGRNDENIWVQTQKLEHPAQVGLGNEFGRSVALKGDLLAIGAWKEDLIHEDGTLLENVGAVYVYRSINGVWTNEAKLTDPDGQSDDHFGVSIAIDHGEIVVGSERADGNDVDSGQVHIFASSEANNDQRIWTTTAVLEAVDGRAGDQFGSRVAREGDTIVVGARDVDERGGQSGAVYVFARNEAGWMQEARLFSSDIEPNDYFGSDVAIQNGTIVASANHGNGILPDTGAIYFFRRVDERWVETDKEFESWRGEGDLPGSGYDHLAWDGVTLVAQGYTGSVSVFVRGETRTRTAFIAPGSLEPFGGMLLGFREGEVATSEIEVAGEGTIRDLDVRLDLFVNDVTKVTIELVPPNGPPIAILENISGSEFVELQGVILDDRGDETIGGAVANRGNAPVRLRGFLTPIESLDTLAGMSITGTWTLRIVDHHRPSPRSGGTVRAWHIISRLEESRVVGDSNRDGAFNSSDLVSVFTAGEYEDEIPGNSRWETGDWNGDGDFTTADLVLAFQASTYVSLARPRGLREIAGAVDLLFKSEDDQKRLNGLA